MRASSSSLKHYSLLIFSSRIILPVIARKLDIASMERLGPFAPLRAGSQWAPMHGEAEQEYRDRMYFQFAAGGFDITRNVIALRGLGLPR